MLRYQKLSHAIRTSFIGRRLVSSKATKEDAVKKNYEETLQALESKKLYNVQPELVSIRELINMYEENELVVTPKFQRDYVWDIKKASRLIVTALCKRFIPGVVFQEKSEGVFHVIDGKQRIISLLAFILKNEDDELYQKLEKNANSRKKLCTSLFLKNDDNYDILHNFEYSMLEKERKKSFRNYKIPVLKIPLGATKEDVFNVFMDINCGGLEITDQQARRASHAGPYIEALDEMVQDGNFKWMKNPTDMEKGTYKLCPKESDRELVLRALAFNRQKGSGFNKITLRSYLNRELDHFPEEDMLKNHYREELQTMKQEFGDVMKICRDTFGTEKAFREWKLSEKTNCWEWRKPISPRLFELMYVVISDLRKLYSFKENDFIRNKSVIKHLVKEVFEKKIIVIDGRIKDKKFYGSYTSLLQRFQESIKPQQNQPRRDIKNKEEVKMKLYKQQDGKCALCKESIEESRVSDGSYAHIDHKLPISKGGTDAPENLQLTHANCNLTKGSSTH